VKKIVLVPLLIAAIVGSAAALDWMAYPESVEKGKFLINAGVGGGGSALGDDYELHDKYANEYKKKYGIAINAAKAIVPIRASVDFAFREPFTLGAEAGFTFYKKEQNVDYGILRYYDATTSGTGLAFGARFGYHPNFGVKNLDVYANAGMGLYVRSWKGEGKPNVSDDPDFPNINEDDSESKVSFSLTVGGRYFFTNNIGIFAEVGLGPLSALTAGLALKF
jgi:opacity protein-like surface antigen